MQYMGSKARIWKHIAPIILKDRDFWYVEPFCGGCNSLDKVDGPRIAADNNFYLIEMWKALQNGWEPPKFVSEEFYEDVKNRPHIYKPEVVAYVGFMSFGAKWFGGYRRKKKGQKGDVENMKYQSELHYRKIMEQAAKLKDVEFIHCNYYELDIPIGSIVYCDPPYAGTTKYKDGFDHEKFWEWVRNISDSYFENKVFVSEYTAPDDFECIWEKEMKVNLDAQREHKPRIEKLFVWKGGK